MTCLRNYSLGCLRRRRFCEEEGLELATCATLAGLPPPAAIDPYAYMDGDDSYACDADGLAAPAALEPEPQQLREERAANLRKRFPDVFGGP